MLCLKNKKQKKKTKQDKKQKHTSSDVVMTLWICPNEFLKDIYYLMVLKELFHF